MVLSKNVENNFLFFRDLFELKTVIRPRIHVQHEKLSRLAYSEAFLKNLY
jgi:hypothetical protein